MLQFTSLIPETTDNQYSVHEYVRQFIWRHHCSYVLVRRVPEPLSELRRKTPGVELSPKTPEGPAKRCKDIIDLKDSGICSVSVCREGYLNPRLLR